MWKLISYKFYKYDYKNLYKITEGEPDTEDRRIVAY